MRGMHHFDPYEIVSVHMDALIPAHHLLRKIDQQIDFSFIQNLTTDCYCSQYGRPSIDPEIFFRLMVISYWYNIASDRQLCEEIRYNLAYRWFCKLSLRDEVPDHSSLTRIRDRFGVERFKVFFQEIIRQCREKGLVKGESVMTDGTLMKADASLDSLVRRESEEESAMKKDLSPVNLVIPSFSYREISNKTHQSQSDPDATLAKKTGTPQGLKYKAHLSIDTESRVVLSVQVTTGACHESQVYLEHLDTLSKELNLNVNEAIADRGYGSGEIVQGVIDRGMVPYIPLWTEKSGSRLEKRTEGFLFDAHNNCYQCPQGIYLLPYSNVTKDQRVTYRSQSKDCRECEREARCPAERMQQSHMRYIRRHIHQALFEETHKQMKTMTFRKKLVDRFWKIEGIISEAKLRHGLSKAKYRGLTKVQIQAYLTRIRCKGLDNLLKIL